jgi:hypothetical protein
VIRGENASWITLARIGMIRKSLRSRWFAR